ncbi:hypothetical protein [Shewanella sp. HN-41]|uniref:hypothetical protein n=1 Tax=Shewanella sp. HN-41 TaxID=327275 RepID=UPI0005626D6C|nr:hypothetical protein [Shewanella sp. HN-41]
MVAMILFPSEHVIQREIFGFQWKIFFAGDEYLFFGVMTACILTLVSSRSDIDKKKERHKLFICCSIALLLALISQRKGAIPYFFFVGLVMYSYNTKYIFYRVLVNAALLLNVFLFFFFLFCLSSTAKCISDYFFGILYFICLCNG